nr:5942_t:CDS:2 [Entrophospora candida]
MILLIKEIRTIPGTKADNAEMWSLEENKEIKENQVGIEINQLEENGEIEATNLVKKSKEDNNNSYLSKLLWNAVALDTAISMLDLLREDDDDTTRNRSSKLSWER